MVSTVFVQCPLLMRKHTTTYTAWITLSKQNSQVVSICADGRQVVWTIPIISVNGIVISNIIRLRSCGAATVSRVHCQIVTPSNFVIWKKRYLFFVLPCCTLQVVMCLPSLSRIHASQNQPLSNWLRALLGNLRNGMSCSARVFLSVGTIVPTRVHMYFSKKYFAIVTDVY
jgi:hypothetical protein